MDMVGGRGLLVRTRSYIYETMKRKKGEGQARNGQG